MEDNRRPVNQQQTENIIKHPQRKDVLDVYHVVYLLKDDTTPTVENIERAKTRNTNPVDLTYFDAGQDGQCLYILGDGFTSIVHDPTKIYAAGAITHLLANKILYCFVRFDGVWYEQCCDTGGGGGAPLAHAATHENGGTDELDLNGLSGLLADPQTPQPHQHLPADITGDISATRKFLTSQGSGVAEADPFWSILGSSDVPNIDAAKITSGIFGIARGGTGLNTLGTPGQVLTVNSGGTDLEYTTLSGGGAYVPHAVNHQNGGIDEIDVTNLSGLLADPQTPLAHFHSTADLNTGTLGIVRGGTGLNAIGIAAQQLRVNAGATGLEYFTPGSHTHIVADITGDPAAVRKFARSLSGVAAWDTLLAGDIPAHNHAASDINSGIFGVARGGTGINVLGTPGWLLATDGLGTGMEWVDPTSFGVAFHGTTHQNGGLDEINVNGLSGLLADAQIPLAHASTHQDGGTDVLAIDEFAAGTDNTNCNATTTEHGLLQKLSGVGTQYLDGTGTWTVPVVATSSFVRKTANQNHALTTYASVTDLVFAISANKNYVITFDVVFQAAAITTGIGFGVTFPAGCAVDVTQLIMGALLAATAGAFGSGYANAADTGAITTAVNTAATSYVAKVSVLVRNGATAGNLQLRVRSEVAAQVTVMAGSFGVLIPV